MTIDTVPFFGISYQRIPSHLAPLFMVFFLLRLIYIGKQSNVLLRHRLSFLFVMSLADLHFNRLITSAISLSLVCCLLYIGLYLWQLSPSITLSIDFCTLLSLFSDDWVNITCAFECSWRGKKGRFSSLVTFFKLTI